MVSRRGKSKALSMYFEPAKRSRFHCWGYGSSNSNGISTAYGDTRAYKLIDEMEKLNINHSKEADVTRDSTNDVQDTTDCGMSYDFTSISEALKEPFMGFKPPTWDPSSLKDNLFPNKGLKHRRRELKLHSVNKKQTRLEDVEASKELDNLNSTIPAGSSVQFAPLTTSNMSSDSSGYGRPSDELITDELVGREKL
ncbi:hypothetical protein PIB30_027366 [Stylosanthes scabra]|uniref:Uncharacterized protein n=1 Tax=Stylosanthes scabra TaxID=79078 RepID=A0ABU6SAN2_9FABA|nr:hypothetical protein [Stylosanthes scabra]